MKLFNLLVVCLFTITCSGQTTGCKGVKKYADDIAYKLGHAQGVQGTAYWNYVNGASDDMTSAFNAAEDCDCDAMVDAITNLSQYLIKINECDGSDWACIKKNNAEAQSYANRLSNVARLCND